MGKHGRDVKLGEWSGVLESYDCDWTVENELWCVIVWCKRRTVVMIFQKADENSRVRR